MNYVLALILTVVTLLPAKVGSTALPADNSLPSNCLCTGLTTLGSSVKFRVNTVYSIGSVTYCTLDVQLLQNGQPVTDAQVQVHRSTRKKNPKKGSSAYNNCTNPVGGNSIPSEPGWYRVHDAGSPFAIATKQLNLGLNFRATGSTPTGLSFCRNYKVKGKKLRVGVF